MRPKRKGFCVLAGLAVLAAGLALPARAAVGVGATLPDVTFRDVGGRTIRTADLQGKPVVIAFWATWCRSCKAELEHLRGVQAARGDRLRILAVSVDEERETLDAYLADHRYPFPVCHDPGRAAAGRFADDEDLPLTIVADGGGIVRSVSRDFDDGAAGRLDRAIEQALLPPPAPNP